MSTFPYPKTEEILRLMLDYEIKISPKCNRDSYKVLLKTFILELHPKVYEPLVETLVDQLTRENVPNYASYYYSLIHQWQYYCSHGEFDYDDNVFVRLSAIIESRFVNSVQIQAPAL